MQCLYRSDYGPPDPSFDPAAGNGQLLRGFQSQAGALSKAQNRGQLEAMERKLRKGEPILWCDQGYGWVYQPAIAGSFEIVVPFMIVLWILLRILPQARGAFARGRWRRGAAARWAAR